MKFAMSRHRRKTLMGRSAPSRRPRTWAPATSLDGLEERKLLSAVATPHHHRNHVAQVHAASGNSISISHPTVVREPNGQYQANFVVSIPFSPKIPFELSYATHDESAKAGTDYTAQASTPPATASAAIGGASGGTSTTPSTTAPGTTAPSTTIPSTTTPSGTTTGGTGSSSGAIKMAAGYSLPTTPYPGANPPAIVFQPGGPTSQTIGVPVATEPGFHFPKHFVLEVDAPGRTRFGVATIEWIHPRNPVPRVSNPVVVESYVP